MIKTNQRLNCGNESTWWERTAYLQYTLKPVEEEMSVASRAAVLSRIRHDGFRRTVEGQETPTRRAGRCHVEGTRTPASRKWRRRGAPPQALDCWCSLCVHPKLSLTQFTPTGKIIGGTFGLLDIWRFVPPSIRGCVENWWIVNIQYSQVD